MERETRQRMREIELLLLMVEESTAQIHEKLRNPNLSPQERERILTALYAASGQYSLELDQRA